jgi:sulfide dehydrogenase cytochrome subunit
LLRYRSDADGGSVMHRMMRGYSEADIEAISAFLAEGVSE